MFFQQRLYLRYVDAGRKPNNGLLVEIEDLDGFGEEQIKVLREFGEN